MNYERQLIDIGLRLLEPLQQVKKHHKMQCLECKYSWSATPISKIQNYKKNGTIGCPQCTNIKKYTQVRIANVERIKDRGFDILSNWDGTVAVGYLSKPLQVTVRNKSCLHTFTTDSKNLLTKNVTCPICARSLKNSILTKSSKARSDKWKETANEWQLYKSKVTALTKISYRAYKDQINPNNMPTGRAGTEGAYHIDHIVPKRYCFEHNIPEEICAHYSNLQMLEWKENVGSRDKLKEGRSIPVIFALYMRL